MRILITGGLGYLGGRLSSYLASQKNCQVIIATGRPDHIGKSDSSAINTVWIDWNSTDQMQEVCNGIDVVIHLAGMNAGDCSKDPVGALVFNGVNTGKLVSASVKAGVKRFVYYSTAHVYKSPLEADITEDLLPTSLHPYATSHRAGEDMVRAAFMRGEMETIVIRLSNAFGAPATKEANCWMLLVNDLCRQVVTTGSMVLTSSGLQRRDFITLSDVCRCAYHLINIPIADIDKNIFNVGGNWAPTVWELADLIRQRSEAVLGIFPKICRKEPLPDETTTALTYHIDRLTETGFVLESKREQELDTLLLFCKASFSGSIT